MRAEEPSRAETTEGGWGWGREREGCDMRKEGGNGWETWVWKMKMEMKIRNEAREDRRSHEARIVGSLWNREWGEVRHSERKGWYGWVVERWEWIGR